MIGCHDFCGHYEWTFAWLERVGGRGLLRDFWDTAIHRDSQRHARELILRDGFAGMETYWGHTLAEESPEQGYHITRAPELFRIDMHACPSKGFLLRNGLRQHADYCDHCMGWIGPLMRAAGFAIDHEHNHLGQCWWEVRPAGVDDAEPAAPGAVSGARDVRLLPHWLPAGGQLDVYRKATDPDAKSGSSAHGAGAD
jgi:hypothetical protein